MKIKELSEITGVSRRNIHFYIEEGLITPAEVGENGYFEFNEKNVTELNLIKGFRELDVPLSSIKIILQAPGSTRVYLKRALVAKKKEIETARRKVEYIESIVDKIPLHNTSSFLETLTFEELKYDDIVINEYDSRVVTHFLYRMFTHKNQSEYQLYIANKINIITQNTDEYPECYTLFNYLVSISDEQISDIYSTRFKHFKEIGGCTPNEYTFYIEKYKQELLSFIKIRECVEEWLISYDGLIIPSLTIYGNETIDSLAKELSHKYIAYQKNSFPILDELYKWLMSDGKNLYDEMKRKFQNKLDLDMLYHGQLINMLLIYEAYILRKETNK